MQNLPPQTLQETAKLEQNARIDLWEIDLTQTQPYNERYRLHAGTNPQGKPVIWQGQAYQPYPVAGSGFEFNGKGPSNRPEITVSNLFGIITGLAETYDGVVGALVIRRVVYAKFLDAVNFEQGNPHADPTQEVIQRYLVEQIAELTSDYARFTLAAPTETDGAIVPQRIMLADICNWRYRTEECGYQGPAVADEFGQPITDPLLDKCGKCRRDCELRNNLANFGGFLAINRLG